MKLATMRLRQRDGVTCGPAVAVVAGALLDPGYRTKLTDAAGRVWFDGEQRRMHLAANRIWPHALGTTPMGVAKIIGSHVGRSGTRYGWRPCRRLWGGADDLADVVHAVNAGWPVAMLVGRSIPRHWVLIVEAGSGVLHCYEPSSGDVRAVEMAAARDARMANLGFPRPFAFVLPRRPSSNI